MKINIYETYYQFFVLPYIGITHNKSLNSNYEIFFGWLKYEIVLSFK